MAPECRHRRRQILLTTLPAGRMPSGSGLGHAWANFIEGEINRQLFNPLGLRFEFRPELSEHGQEEEVQRASAYKAYIDAGMRPSIAAQVVGIDLPPDIEFDALDENFDKPVEDPKEEEQKDEEPQKTAMTIEQLRNWSWQSFAFRKLKRKILGLPIRLQDHRGHSQPDS